MGVAMGGGLYEAAGAALVRLYGPQSRAAITGITLVAGFASTVGWPLSTLLEAELGWRGACMASAGLHLLMGLPLDAWGAGALMLSGAIGLLAAAALATVPRPVAQESQR